MRLRGQFARFAVVGTIGFAVDASVLTVAVSVTGMGPYLARVLSFGVAATVTWYLNRRYTFSTRRASSGALSQWSRFVAVNALGACINFAVYAALIASSDIARRFLLLAVAAGSVAGLVSNFTLSRAFVFPAGGTGSRHWK